MKRVYFASGYSNWWGEYPPDVLDVDRGRTVGGGEAGMLETAFGLAKRGWGVTIFSCAERGLYKDVVFRPEREYLTAVWENRPEVVVAWSDAEPLRCAPPGVARALAQQLNDLVFAPGWEQSVDILISPSHNHVEMIRRLGWSGETVAVHNGCHPWQWADAPPPRERPLQVGYWSSPDRGLHLLLRAWPRIRDRVPGARLVVAYEVERLFGITRHPDRGDEHIARINVVRDLVLASRCDPTISFTGAISRARLREIQKQTRVMAYPSAGISYTEGFCVAALEACAAGVFPVMRPVDALPSIYDGVARWLPLDTGSSDFEDALVNGVVYGLTGWAERDAPVAVPYLLRRAEEYTWDSAVGEMESALARAVDIRSHREGA